MEVEQDCIIRDRSHDDLISVYGKARSWKEPTETFRMTKDGSSLLRQSLESSEGKEKRKSDKT